MAFKKIKQWFSKHFRKHPPKKDDRIDNITTEVEATRQILQDKMEDYILGMESLAELEAQAQEMQTSALKFKHHSRRHYRLMWFRNLKFKFIIGVVVAAGISIGITCLLSSLGICSAGITILVISLSIAVGGLLVLGIFGIEKAIMVYEQHKDEEEREQLENEQLSEDDAEPEHKTSDTPKIPLGSSSSPFLRFFANPKPAEVVNKTTEAVESLTLT